MRQLKGTTYKQGKKMEEGAKLATRAFQLGFEEMKKRGEQVAWITTYNYPMATLVEKSGMDMILIGDSLGMVVLGYNDTSPVTMEDCISHCQAVRRGAPNTFCIGDMPFLSYHVSVEESIRNAGRFIREAQMDARCDSSGEIQG